MFFKPGPQPPQEWTEVSIFVAFGPAKRVEVLPEFGEVVGFFARCGRIVINTSSGIPIIACAAPAEGLDKAIINVRKMRS